MYQFNKKTALLTLALSACSILGLNAEKARIFTPDNGLSNSHINHIYQDSEGFIWISTENGLNKFNGYEFTVYSGDPNDTTSLQGNYVSSVHEDRRGRFWVATSSGLLHYDRSINQFHLVRIQGTDYYNMRRVSWIMEDRAGNIWVSYPGEGIICFEGESLQPVFYTKNNSGIGDNTIRCAYEDKHGNIWLGSQNHGIYVFNPFNYTTKHYQHNPSDRNSLNNNRILTICEDVKGRILIGTIGGGINIFDEATHSFSALLIDPAFQAENFVYSLMVDKDSTLWVGTDGSGIFCYDSQWNKSTLQNEFSDICNLGRSKVQHIFQDKQGNIWVALHQEGILLIPFTRKNFQNYGFNPFDPSKSIGTHCVISIIEDSKKNIWIGTDGDGLYKIRPSGNIEHFSVRNTPGFHSDVITGLFEDRDENIWIGTYVNGLFRYNNKTGRFDYHITQSGTENDLSYNHAATFAQDKSGLLWIGTNGGGVITLNIESGQLNSFLYTDNPSESNQLSSNWIYDILIDSDNIIWIGTSNGVNSLDPLKNQFTSYPSFNNRLNSNLIYSLHEDRKGNIWVASYYGLHSYNKKTGETSIFTTKSGLPDNMITGIEEDENNMLWISTGKGICRFDPTNKTCLNFYVEDGLQGNEFRRGSHAKGFGNRMYFGGINGVTSFYPEQISFEKTPLSLVFTDFLIYNEPVTIGKSSILSKSLNETEHIQLKYDERSFSFKFAALEYTAPQRVRYYTQIENFDTQWRPVDHPNRTVTYTNLDPGTYTFKIRADIDGNHTLQKEIQVVILPPFWLTVWAKILYFIIFIAIIYSVYSYTSHRMRQRREMMEKEQQKQLSESKLQFFTDISHEIRTPLTLIIGPLEKMINTTSNQMFHSSFQIMYRNANRILKLINQLMDLRAIEKGKRKLKVESVNIHEFTRNIMDSFLDLATAKQIDFRFNADDNLLSALIDRDCLDKIIFNLLSNAFNFTPDNGHIIVSLRSIEDKELEISVEDSGIGIPKDKQELLFDRFYQIRDNKLNTKGTGIGLHLSKMMAELHHGSISVESEAGHGSIFFVRIPLNEEAYASDELTTRPEYPQITIQHSDSFVINKKNEPEPKETIKQRPKTSISLLVVEDNADIQNYIQTELSIYYHIIKANNGKEGLECALRHIPDIIISDIVMPEMDGLTLCKLIKTNENTCHIPIILLTAKTSVEQRIEGLEMGADSYIPKPFNIKHLKTRIDKLIYLRETLKQKYTGKLEAQEENIKVVTSDEKLLARFNEQLKEQISNPDLNVGSISKELGISRVHLNRRLKAITNESPGNYIRNYRLKHAAWLLMNKNMTIAEIAYAVGFSSHAYFSSIFKEHYGMPPTEYINKVKIDS